MSSLIRINKLLSQLGIASRRKADQLIEEGAVTLNGEVLAAPGAVVDITKDKLLIGGKQVDLQPPKKWSYLMLNKPEGYISTVKDTHKRRTIMELIPETAGLFPVGRLDKDTTGLILITNDGELAHRLMHPSYEVEKRYEVEIPGGLSSGAISSLETGVDINEKRPSVCKVLKVERLIGATKVILEIHQGKKRQVRRTFEALGYRLNSLKRISYAGLKLNVKKGSYRKLTDSEVSHLKKKAGLS